MLGLANGFCEPASCKCNIYIDNIYVDAAYQYVAKSDIGHMNQASEEEEIYD